MRFFLGFCPFFILLFYPKYPCSSVRHYGSPSVFCRCHSRLPVERDGAVLPSTLWSAVAFVWPTHQPIPSHQRQSTEASFSLANHGHGVNSECACTVGSHAGLMQCTLNLVPDFFVMLTLSLPRVAEWSRTRIESARSSVQSHDLAECFIRFIYFLFQ